MIINENPTGEGVHSIMDWVVRAPLRTWLFSRVTWLLHQLKIIFISVKKIIKLLAKEKR
jgi:hypothetical protein